MTNDAAPHEPRRDSPTVDFTRRAAAGDAEAFRYLYERHFHRVLRATALRLGRMLKHCEHEIEDAVHEAFSDTFLRIENQTIPDIYTDGAFRAYVSAAADNQVRSRARRAQADKRGGDQVRRRADLIADSSAGETLFSLLQGEGPSPSQVARANELEERLERAILDLEEPYRTAIELHYICQMSNAEIAATGRLISPRSKEPVQTREAVKLIVYRARRMLDPLLDDA